MTGYIFSIKKGPTLAKSSTSAVQYAHCSQQYATSNGTDHVRSFGAANSAEASIKLCGPRVLPQNESVPLRRLLDLERCPSRGFEYLVFYAVFYVGSPPAVLYA